MKKLILFTAVVLSFHATLRAQLIDPVEFDGSQAIEMEVKWSWQTAETSTCTYVRDLGGTLHNNIVFFHLGSERQSWKTYPTLDTQNVFTSWPEGVSGGPIEFEYDGIPGPEYLTGNGVVIRFEDDNKRIITVDTISPRFQDRFVSDINGDGYRDVVYRSYNSDRWFISVFAGPGMGRGPERALELPRYFTTEEPLRNRQAMRLMRCGDGQLRVVYCGTPRRGQSGIWLLDVHLEKRDTGWSVEYTVADSIVQAYQHNNDTPNEPWVVRPITCVDDPNTNRQWAIVNWEQGYHRAGLTTVLYEVTDGRLVERMVHKGQLIPSSLSCSVFEGTFDAGESIVRYGRVDHQNFARISTLHKPFAKVDPVLGSSQVFIDDQYNDGSKDLFSTSTSSVGRLALVNFDLRPSSVPDTSPQYSWAQMVGTRLQVTLAMNTRLVVHVVDATGKQARIFDQHLPAGAHSVDLSAHVHPLPPGGFFVRVSDGSRMQTIPYLR